MLFFERRCKFLTNHNFLSHHSLTLSPYLFIFHILDKNDLRPGWFSNKNGNSERVKEGGEERKRDKEKENRDRKSQREVRQI
jgi:hypothetical protein